MTQANSSILDRPYPTGLQRTHENAVSDRMAAERKPKAKSDLPLDVIPPCQRQVCQPLESTCTSCVKLTRNGGGCPGQKPSRSPGRYPCHIDASGRRECDTSWLGGL